ncbi:hypothetical protein COLO4_35033 [Corchorus olitorius]|uniref:Uncharacterized protein n=1 Tax=Corchorus olitorius TaxID=93759 RepID=A0A1R3GID9_9ROSI|nr:hypothetical protein COLO4_35033 [Corchorus olitorius]
MALCFECNILTTENAAIATSVRTTISTKIEFP